MVVILGQQNSQQEDSFLKNAALGSLDLLKGFVEQGVDVNVSDDAGRTALHRMAEAGANVSKLRYLAEQGAKMDARDHEGVTPLMLAFENQKVDVARFLIEKAGADPQAKDNAGNGIADRLFDSQKVRKDIAGDDLVWLAVKHVDDLQGQTDRNGKNNLHKLAAMPDLNNLERMLVAGLDPHQGRSNVLLLPGEKPPHHDGIPPHIPLEQLLNNQFADDVAKHTLKTFRSLPRVPDDLSGLTASTLLAPDDKGRRLLDNPLLWKRMPEVIATLEQKGEPLPSHEQLSSGGVMGHSPLSIALHTRAFDSVERCLAAHGESISAEDFGKGTLSKFGEAALETGLLDTLMQPERWSGKLPELRRFYQDIPPKARDSIQNFQQLQQQVRATMPQTQGIGR